MSSYLRSLDVYNHPISTSFSDSNGDQAVQASTALNFTMTHNYGSSDIATMAAQYVRIQYTESSIIVCTSFRQVRNKSCTRNLPTWLNLELEMRYGTHFFV